MPGSSDSQFQAPISGTVTAVNQTKDLTTPNPGTSVLQLTGTWVGTLVLEGSNDGTNYVTIQVLPSTTFIFASSITANGVYLANTNGYQSLRLRSSLWTSGTATYNVYGSDSTSIVYSNVLNLPSTVDTNYGVVSASTLRTASHIGNSTGAAAFGAGTTSVQTLRVVLPTDQTTIPVSAASLPLPAGAATSANQTTEITALQIIDDVPTAQNGALVKGVPIMGQLDDASTTAATEDAIAAARITAQRALHTNLRNNAGTEIGTTAAPIASRLSDGSDLSLITPSGDLQVADLINVAGQYRAQSVTTSAAEALGAASILSNRKMISITPTNGTVYWGYSNSVTTVNGTPIFKNQTMVISVGSNVHIYLIAGSTVDCRITEGS